MSQALLNLIVNAAHAVGQANADGDEVQGVIRLSTRNAADSVSIVVEDSGTGMTDAVKQKIFDPLFTTKAVGKGTGQGLTMVYSTIVEKHNGQLAVDSTVGEGATFTLTIPKTTDGSALAA